MSDFVIPMQSVTSQEVYDADGLRLNACSLVGREAPDFTLKAVMPDSSIEEVKLSGFRKHYVLLFFFPMDFTFVCPTEIIAFSDAVPAFEQRNTQILACSTDSVYSHLAWRHMSRAEGGIGEVAYPMLSDICKRTSAEYGVLLPEQGVAQRGLFLIDKSGIVQHELINNLSIGRDVNEALRVLDALQFTEEHGEVCPANWHRTCAECSR
ncbi:MAG: peroxiredoxin [Planctomycetia bacterium]|nr:peroxiredoxin [Planctomycetia bacterium]